MRSDRAPALLLAVLAWAAAPPAARGGPAAGGQAAAPAPAVAPAPAFRPASPDHAWRFPADHFTRPGFRNEWWYFTGNLVAVDGRRLGFQFTVFRVGLLPAPPPLASDWRTDGAIMIHLAITDPSAHRHRFSEVLWRDAPLLAGLGAPPGPRVAWALAPPGTAGRWTLDLDGATWRLDADDDAAAISLHLRATAEGAPVLEGKNGYSRKAAAAGYASEYYSEPRLAIEGTLGLAGATVAVRGRGWMDREVGSSQLAPSQVGWDWLALRLDDGRSLMLYLLRRADGAVDWSSGELVARDGTASPLAAGEFEVRPTGRWRSPETGATYPSGWRVEVPGARLSLEVRPELAAAEDRSRLVPGLFYWEGPVEVRAGGARAGEGYVELTGYGPGSRPPL